MTTNADITIYNKRLDEETRREICYPTVIQGVSFHEAVGAKGSQENRSESSKHSIRIPYGANTGGKTYVNAEAYAGLDDVSGYWTIQVDDLIRLGQYPGTATDPDELVDVERLIIGEYADNTTRGSAFTKHWRVLCGKE